MLRVISAAPRLRRVVEGFVTALPGMAESTGMYVEDFVFEAGFDQSGAEISLREALESRDLVAGPRVDLGTPS